MTELSNDSRTYFVVEDTRATFDVQVGGRSGTPTIEVPVVNGNLVEVTCQFIAQNPGGGFAYSIDSLSNDAVKLTRRAENISQDSTGWQSCIRTDLFRAHLPQATADEDVTFEVKFEAGGLSNPGKAGSFVLIARVVGSQVTA